MMLYCTVRVQYGRFFICYFFSYSNEVEGNIGALLTRAHYSSMLLGAGQGTGEGRKEFLMWAMCAKSSVNLVQG